MSPETLHVQLCGRQRGAGEKKHLVRWKDPQERMVCRGQMCFKKGEVIICAKNLLLSKIRT